MYRHLSRSPIARYISAAHTDESTPPEIAISALSSPTVFRMSSTARSANASIDHQGSQPQMPPAKFASICSPSGSFDSA